MAITVSKTFAAGEILTASDLNGIESNIIDNAQSLTTPRTAVFDMNGFELTLDSDGDTGILSDNDDRIDMKFPGGDHFRFDGSTASSVNGLDFLSSATSNPPQIAAVGTDTNIDIQLTPKGSGAVKLAANLDLNSNAITQGGSEEVITFTDVASAVNEVNVSNAATGNPAIITCSGETDVGLQIYAKGAGTLQLGDANLVFPDSDGSSGQAITTNGSGTLSFGSALGTAAQMRGYIAGYVMSNDTDTDHDINITAGTCMDAAASVFMQRAEITKQIDATWAAGDDAGGFPDGLSLSQDWYHVFILSTADGATVDAGFDNSITATNLLADTAVTAASLTKYRRVGSVLTDGTNNIIAFTQVGDVFLWDVPVSDDNASNPGTGARTISLTVPPDVEVRPLGSIWVVETDSNSRTGILTSLGTTGAGPSGTLRNYEGRGTGSVAMAPGYGNLSEVTTNTSGQVRTQLGGSGLNTTQGIMTIGWVDPRGRND